MIRTQAMPAINNPKKNDPKPQRKKNENEMETNENHYNRFLQTNQKNTH
jgi:hypothetical protein